MPLPNQKLTDPAVERNFRDLSGRFVGHERVASLPAARVYNSGAFTHNSTGNFLAITFDSERWDTGGLHSTAANTSRLTVAIAGLYVIHGHAQWDSNTTGVRILGIRINGTTDIAQERRWASVGTFEMGVTTQYKLAVSDYIELMAFQNSGANRTINAVANHSPEFAATWLHPAT